MRKGFSFLCKASAPAAKMFQIPFTNCSTTKAILFLAAVILIDSVASLLLFGRV